MQVTRRFALGALVGAILAGCGGGGGGGGTGGGDTGSGGPGPATGSGPGTGTGTGSGGQAFAAFGPTLLATDVDERAPVVARLAGGGNVALWFDDGEIRGQLTDAAGNPAGSVFTAVAPSFEGTYRLAMGPMAVAPASDGGFVLAYLRDMARPMTQFSAVTAVRVKRFSATGATVWDTQASEATSSSVSQPTIKAAGEQFILGWTAEAVLPAPYQGYLQRIGTDGSRVGPQATVGPLTRGEQDQVRVAPLADGTVGVVWRERSMTQPVVTSHFYRHFAADFTPLTGPLPLPAVPVGTPYPVDVEALAGGNLAIAWGTPGPNTRPTIAAAVYTPAGVAVSQPQSTALEFPPTDVRVLSFGAAGFGVAWQVERIGPRETSASIYLWRFDAGSAPLGAPEEIERRLTYWVSPTMGNFVSAGSGFDIKGGADGHYVATFLRANEQPDAYLVGR